MALEMGSAWVDITPRTPCHLAGYASRDHAHEGVHDELRLRALFASGQDGGAAVLITADVIGFGPVAGPVRDALQRELGVKPEHVFLAGTHTHSAPTTYEENADREWMAALETRALAAAALARTRCRPVKLRSARGICRIGLNRREERPDGSIALGHNPNGVADREVIVVVAEDQDAEIVARIMNFACHGVVLGPRNYQISGDWMGLAAGGMEDERPGSAALFFNGGAGNVDPRVRVQERFEPAQEIADEFTDAVERCGEALVDLPRESAIAGVEETVRLPRKLRAVENGEGRTRRVLLRALRVGPLCLAGYPGEMFSETAMAVKEASPHACTMICTYLDESRAGYCPVREAYDTGGYEVRTSPYNEEAEGVLRRGLIDALKRL